MIHVYTVIAQPATRFVDDCGLKPVVITHADNARVWCGCCGRRRLAKNAVVHVYYDHHSYWCAPGKGCNGEPEVKAKRWRQFRNRSLAAKAAWARRRAA